MASSRKHHTTRCLSIVIYTITKIIIITIRFERTPRETTHRIVLFKLEMCAPAASCAIKLSRNLLCVFQRVPGERKQEQPGSLRVDLQVQRQDLSRANPARKYSSVDG